MTDVSGNPEEERQTDFYYQPWAQEAVCRYFYQKIQQKRSELDTSLGLKTVIQTRGQSNKSIVCINVIKNCNLDKYRLADTGAFVKLCKSYAANIFSILLKAKQLANYFWQ